LEVLKRSWKRGEEVRKYFYFEEILGGTVDLLEGLLAGIWEGLHGRDGLGD
jgi:hypothetical protein